MKLIIDIPEDDREDICNIHFIREDLKFKVGGVIMHGTPFDSVIEDIKSEINEKLQEPEYQHEGEDWQSGLIMAETIIDKHISAEESEGNDEKNN